MLVTYYAEDTIAGNFRLRRDAGGDRRIIPGLFRMIQFQQLEATGGPYVRVTLRVAADDTTVKGGSDEAVLSALVRIMGPEMIGSSSLSWGFLNGLSEIPFGDPQ